MPDAVKLERITYQDALVRDLKAIDATALSLCRDNGMPMQIFGIEPEGSVTAAILGKEIGTIVGN